MFLTRANATSWFRLAPSQFSSTSQPPSLGWISFMTMGSGDKICWVVIKKEEAIKGQSPYTVHYPLSCQQPPTHASSYSISPLPFLPILPFLLPYLYCLFLFPSTVFIVFSSFFLLYSAPFLPPPPTPTFLFFSHSSILSCSEFSLLIPCPSGPFIFPNHVFSIPSWSSFQPPLTSH